LPAAQFLEVVCGVAGRGGVRRSGALSDFLSQRGGAEAAGRSSQGGDGLHRCSHARLVDVAAAARLADEARSGQIFQGCVANPSHVDAAQRLPEALEQPAQLADDLRERLQPPSAAQSGRVVGNRPGPQRARALGMELDGQPAEVDLEDRQVIRGNLEHALAAWRRAAHLDAPLFDAEDRLHRSQVQQAAYS
jgi:hypothetical protein